MVLQNYPGAAKVIVAVVYDRPVIPQKLRSPTAVMDRRYSKDMMQPRSPAPNPLKACARILGLLALALLLATPALAANSPSPLFPELNRDPLYSAFTYQALRDITVDVSWNQAEMRTVLRDLTLIVRTTHPVNASIDFQFSSSATPIDRARRITFRAKGIPIFNLLEALAQQDPFTIKVREDLVLVVPQAAVR
jgi:hypothetical protein